MKRIILALMCLVAVHTVVAAPSGLIVTGDFIQATNVNYEICLLNEDGTCATILEKEAHGNFDIVLEPGHQYAIYFTDGITTKTLIVNAESPGLFEVDIDFGNDNSALLKYSVIKRRYKLSRLKHEEDYVQSN